MRNRVILIAAATAFGAAAALASPADAVVDTTPPNVNFNPGLFFKVGTVLSSNGADPSLPANVTWATNDDVGIASQFAIAYSYDSNFDYVGSTQTSSNSARQLAAVPFHPMGEIDAYDDVYDAAGNGTEGYGYYSGDVAQSNTFNLSAGWTSAACNCWSFGSTMKSSTAGASMSYTFTGNSFAVIGDQASGRGTFKVLVNGVQQGGTYSTEQGATKNMVVVYQKRFSSRASRTVKIQVVSGRVDVDAIVYSTGSTGSYSLN